jgi:hypothetical protein
MQICIHFSGLMKEVMITEITSNHSDLDRLLRQSALLSHSTIKGKRQQSGTNQAFNIISSSLNWGSNLGSNWQLRVGGRDGLFKVEGRLCGCCSRLGLIGE